MIIDEREIQKDKLWKDTGDNFLGRFTDDPIRHVHGLKDKKREWLKKYIIAS